MSFDFNGFGVIIKDFLNSFVKYIYSFLEVLYEVIYRDEYWYNGIERNMKINLLDLVIIIIFLWYLKLNFDLIKRIFLFFNEVIFWLYNEVDIILCL